MNRLLSFLLLIAAVAFGYFLYLRQDAGYFAIGIGNYKLETTLLVFGTAIFIIAFTVLLLFSVLETIFKKLANVSGFFSSQLDKKTRSALTLSLVDLTEGRYNNAEKRLLKAIKKWSDNFPLYLAAASAAHKLHADERRDNYLQLAQINASNSELAVGLIKSEFYLENNQAEKALDTLRSIEKFSPKNERVLILQGEAHRQLGQWRRLLDLVPKLLKHKVISKQGAQELETECWYEIVKNTDANREQPEQYKRVWSEIPQHLKTSSDFVDFYVCALKQNKQNQFASGVILQFLETGWDDSLMENFSTMDAEADQKLLDKLENWLSHHQDNVYLLLLLGKVCVKCELWGKARSYLEASYSIKPLPETCLHLAMLLEDHIGEPEAAQDFYRKGLHLAINRTIDPTSPNKFKTSSKPKLKIVAPK